MAIFPNIRPKPKAKVPPDNWPSPIIEANYDFTNEWCPDAEPPDVHAMVPEGNAAAWTWHGMVKWNRLYACIQSALGVNWVDYGTPDKPKLQRVLPLRHPVWPNMYCTRIVSIEGYKANGTFDQLFATGQRGGISLLPEFLYRWADNFGTYQQVKVGLQFEPRTYPVWPDLVTPVSITDPPPQVNQFVSPFADTTNIVLTIDAGLLSWAEGPGWGTNWPPVGIPIQKGPPEPVTVKTTKILETANVRLMWHRVPLDWTHDVRNVLVAASRLQGAVNATRFRGFNQQTLRALAPKESPWIVEPALCRNPAWPIQFSTNIEYLFQYFEPRSSFPGHNPNDDTGLFPGAGDLGFCYGHNLGLYNDFNFYGMVQTAAAKGVFAPNLPFAPLNSLAELGELFEFYARV